MKNLIKKSVYLAVLMVLAFVSCEHEFIVEHEHIYEYIYSDTEFEVVYTTEDSSCYLIEVYIRGEYETSFPEVCDGEKGDKGDPGKDGQDGKDGVDGSDGKDGEDGQTKTDTTVIILDNTQMHSTTYGLENGCDSVVFWIDANENSLYEEDSEYVGHVIVCDGEKGDKGDPGKDGQDGQDGADGQDGQDGQDGKDGVDGQDGKDGINGEDGKTIIRETFFENCDNSGNSPYYWSIDWLFPEGFSINQCGSDSDNGSLVYYGAGTDTIWSPELFSKPMSISEISFKYNSRNNYETKIVLMDSYGEISQVNKIETYENNYFDWQKSDKYETFNYSVSVENLEFHNIVRWGLIVKNVNSKTGQGRNYEFNVDNISLTGLEIIDF